MHIHLTIYMYIHPTIYMYIHTVQISIDLPLQAHVWCEYVHIFNHNSHLIPIDLFVYTHAKVAFQHLADLGTTYHSQMIAQLRCRIGPSRKASRWARKVLMGFLPCKADFLAIYINCRQIMRYLPSIAIVDPVWTHFSILQRSPDFSS